MFDKYLHYLRTFEQNVFVAKEDKMRIGVVVPVQDTLYFIPITSKKKKQQHMKRQVDVFQIENGELGQLNINNMIPVSKAVIHFVKFDEVKDTKYKTLLQKQYFYLKKHEQSLLKQVKKVYDVVTSERDNDFEKQLRERSCNFKRLEVLMNYY